MTPGPILFSQVSTTRRKMATVRTASTWRRHVSRLRVSTNCRQQELQAKLELPAERPSCLPATLTVRPFYCGALPSLGLNNGRLVVLPGCGNECVSVALHVGGSRRQQHASGSTRMRIFKLDTATSHSSSLPRRWQLCGWLDSSNRLLVRSPSKPELNSTFFW